MAKHELECRALDVLLSLQADPDYGLQFPLDASRVAEFLGIDVVWDQLPADDIGPLAARILPLERLIEINEAVLTAPAGFGESTLAHEIGHWVLHIDRDAVARLERLQGCGVAVSAAPFLCRNATELQGLEWQAQYFAGCLLMPRHELVARCGDRDLTQWPQLYALAAELGVTISNLTHRLGDLGWIALAPDSRQLAPGPLASTRSD
ncbi:MAG: ImmA/IrrE family metallo-endopeptidase [Spirulinaceae cyanobacterium RM2_2_10]|nr:ImmA/IrrE family metallo-endopeptidase [Spirulinaceae cyanobacterium SM2_1_0]NJO19805.1 ImmA/IrrE family metallo-endopeptidase [Spirulinaceae cyanobacterium RM2_2_10]